jgi:hypothetical protein
LEAFGEKLRRQREQRGLTLETISSTTKISTRMLRALEEERFDQLPGGVFNKGFIRAYAHQVGLDEQEAITDYLAALHASQLQSVKTHPDHGSGDEEADEKGDQPSAGSGVIAAPADSVRVDRRQRMRRGHGRRNNDRTTDERSTESTRDGHNKEPWRIENRAAADLLRSAWEKENDGSALDPGMNIFASGTFGEARSEKSGIPIPWVATAVLLVIFAGLIFWTVRRHRLYVQPSDGVSRIAPGLSPSTLPIAAPPLPRSSPTSQSARTKLESAALTKPEKTSVAKPQIIATHTSSAAAFTRPSETATPFTLLIRAEKTSWVSITADGKTVAEETLIAPAEKSVRASGQIVVKTGNAAGISFLLNAKEISSRGKDGEVRTYVFDASGIKVSGPPQLPEVN